MGQRVKKQLLAQALSVMMKRFRRVRFLMKNALLQMGVAHEAPPTERFTDRCRKSRTNCNQSTCMVVLVIQKHHQRHHRCVSTSSHLAVSKPQLFRASGRKADQADFGKPSAWQKERETLKDFSS